MELHAVRELGIDFLASLACLVPPPFVDLLFAHGEFISIVRPHDFNALSGPHYVPFQFTSQNLDFSLGLSLPFPNDLLASVGVSSVFFTCILVSALLGCGFAAF